MYRRCFEEVECWRRAHTAHTQSPQSCQAHVMKSLASYSLQQHTILMPMRAVLCASKHHQPILKMTVQIQGSILYCIKLRIHGTSSSVLPNRLLLIHMLEYVEQHPTLYIFRKKHFGMMNVQCIYDALSRWNVGEGHIRHTRSHHSPAKLT